MAATYEVTDIKRTTYAPPGGVLGPGMEVTFQTKPTGLVGVVMLPLAQFSTDQVDQAVTAAAKTLEDVKAL